MKKLKRFLALLLALTMVASMAACGGNNAGKETSPQGGTPVRLLTTPLQHLLMIPPLLLARTCPG